MKFVVICSEKDEAGKNIFKYIHENFPSLNHYLITDKETIYADNLNKQQTFRDYDFLVFATKHQGNKEKMLSVHAPGNWKKAELGGKEGKVCLTSAFVLKTFFQELNKNVPEGWQATLECTHHGPYIEKPCLFIEIGSNEQNWQDKEAGKAIAKTILSAIERVNFQTENWIPAIGLGGPHYCSNFNKIQLNSEYALGHIVPEYMLPITEEMILQAIAKTQEKNLLVLLDWKGLGKSQDRQEVVRLLNKLNLKYLKTSEIKLGK